MTTEQLGLIAPLASPLPPSAKGELLTPSQWTTLMAIGDTVIPKIDSATEDYSTTLKRLQDVISEKDDPKIANAYLSEPASSIPELRDCVRRILCESLRPEATKGVSVLLSALK